MEKYTDEIKHLIEDSQSGNWIPFGIVLGLLGLVIFLIIFILKTYQKHNDERHDKSELILEKVVATQSDLGAMVLVHEAEIQNLKG